MGDKTKIEWADETWNPLVGCSKAGGPGCENCYAIPLVHRGMSAQHRGLTVRTDDGVDWNGELREVRHLLDRPIRQRRPRKIFVNSLSDLFHPGVRLGFIAEVFAVMALSPQHTFQVLTKRPQRMAQVLSSDQFHIAVADEIAELASAGGTAGRVASEWSPTTDWWPLPNVWLGTSIETDRYSFRADHLRATPAAIRWVSAEPLLGPLPNLDLTDIDWVVVGGESGSGARPMHPAWVTEIRDRCAAAGVPWLMKQWGSWAPRGRLVDGEPLPVDNDMTLILNVAGNTRGKAAGSLSNHLCEFPDGSHCEVMERVPKSRSGRLLAGVLHDSYPR